MGLDLALTRTFQPLSLNDSVERFGLCVVGSNLHSLFDGLFRDVQVSVLVGGFRRLHGFAKFPSLRDRSPDRLCMLAQVRIDVVDSESLFQEGLSGLQLSLGQSFVRLLPQPA